ncbi:MAG: hypothetical protein WA280_20085 [Xanthobacteraceae bacterium]
MTKIRLHAKQAAEIRRNRGCIDASLARKRGAAGSAKCKKERTRDRRQILSNFMQSKAAA